MIDYHLCSRNQYHLSLRVSPESTRMPLQPSLLTNLSSLIKSRFQAGSAAAARYKSTVDGILTVIQEEGVEGLYKGIGSKLTQSVLTAAILFAGQRRFYEIVKKVCLHIAEVVWL